MKEDWITVAESCVIDCFCFLRLCLPCLSVASLFASIQQLSMSLDDFAALDGALNTPPSSQQASQGKLKGAGGGTTPFQPEAGMGELVGLCEFIKETSEEGIVRGICGACYPNVGERVRFCRKWVVDKAKWTCGPVSHQGLPEA